MTGIVVLFALSWAAVPLVVGFAARRDELAGERYLCEMQLAERRRQRRELAASAEPLGVLEGPVRQRVRVDLGRHRRPSPTRGCHTAGS